MECVHYSILASTWCIDGFYLYFRGEPCIWRLGDEASKTRVGAQVLAAILGVIIFIDDYFNALAVGQVARPITDRHKVSRAKLAYIIDSTSAPICVVSPVSSWGAFIIAIIASIIAEQGLSNVSAFSSFLSIIPMNLYVWASIGIVLVVAFRNVNLGQMKIHEERAIVSGELYDQEKEIPGELSNELPESKNGSVKDLIVPILALMVGTVGSIIWTGYQGAGEWAILSILENTDPSAALLYGGIIGVAVGLVMIMIQVVRDQLGAKVLTVGLLEGIKSMLPAIYILILAWMIVSLIGDLGTGEFLADIVRESNLSLALLPFLLFLVAGVMAFSTGTSWGSFGILLPIAGEIVVATDVNLFLPALAAVLAGAVFGDHCSPISDTTILSSTGAGSNHIDHVLTQLPYAVIGAVMASVGYLVMGLTSITWLGLLTVLVLVGVFAIVAPRHETN